MQQLALFATLSDSDTAESLLVIALVVVVDRFGWTTFGATERKRVLEIVSTAAGATMTVFTVKMFQLRASVKLW